MKEHNVRQKYRFEVALAYFVYFHFMLIYTLTITIISYYYSTRSGIYIVHLNPLKHFKHDDLEHDALMCPS